MNAPTGPGDTAPPAPAASPRRDVLVAELTKEVRAARAATGRELGRLGGLVAENAELLSVVLPRVAELAGDVAGLSGRVDALTAAAGEPDAVAPVDWPRLDAAAAATEWEKLADWVAGVLGPWYEIRRGELPDCWAWHRPAVIELMWLRHHYVAMHAPTARPGAAAEWHVRWKPAALTNIAAAIPPLWCRPGEHRVHQSVSRLPRDGGPGPRPTPRHPGATGRAGGPGEPRTGPEQEITAALHWGPYYREAYAADLQWRRERYAATAGPAGS